MISFLNCYRKLIKFYLYPSIFFQFLLISYSTSADQSNLNTNQLKSLAHIKTEARSEVAFSPDKGARELVIKAIDSATKEILILAYIWTARDLTTSLIAAKNRGVEINLIFDYKSNLDKETNSEINSSLLRLKNSGINLRASSKYAIMHNKVMLIDGRHLLTGSYNFTQSAATKNAENVLVLWHYPQLVKQYRREFDDLWMTAVTQ